MFYTGYEGQIGGILYILVLIWYWEPFGFKISLPRKKETPEKVHKEESTEEYTKILEGLR
jgi:hypothetical protein